MRGHRPRATRYLVVGAIPGPYAIADGQTGHLLPERFSTERLARAEAERLNGEWRQQRIRELLEEWRDGGRA